MVLNRTEQKRREVLEKELREAEKVYTQRRLTISDQIESRKSAATRESTDKVTLVHREFHTQKELAEKWLTRERKKLESEFADKIGALSGEKNRICQMIEQDMAQALQTIGADEGEAMALWNAERAEMLRRHRDVLDPPTEPELPVESEAKCGEES